MNVANLKKLLIFIISGILVAGIPLFFLGYLSEKILTQSRQTALEVQKEMILQEAENFKSRLSPESYLKATFENIQSDLLPDLNNNLISLFPDKNYGVEFFNSEFPLKFVKRLELIGIEPLLVLCNPPEFKNYWYWFSDDLLDQIGNEADYLARSISNKNLNLAKALYSTHFQKTWKNHLTPNHPSQKISAISSYTNYFFNRYISRYNDYKGEVNTVFKVYTDYFSSQYLFGYNFCSISPVNLHGAYSVFVKQSSISPAAIGRYACNSQTDKIKCELNNSNDFNSNGFVLKDNILYFITPIPNTFFSHVRFYNSLSETKAFPTDIKLLVSSDIRNLTSGIEKLDRSIDLCIKLAGILILFSGAYFFLFGAYLPINLHKKLLIALGILTLVPVSTTGILSYYLYSGYERIIENYITARIQNKFAQFCRYEDEVRVIIQNKCLRAKKSFERSKINNLNLSTIKKLFPELWEWISGITIITQTGNYLDFNEAGPTKHTLARDLITKYLINQGLSKARGQKAHEMELKTNITMGVLESFLTPEIEESLSVHEGTLQRQVIHTADIFTAVLMIIRNIYKKNFIIFARNAHSEGQHYNYLADLSLNHPELFSIDDPLCQIKFGIRLRRHQEYSNYSFPLGILSDKDLATAFRKALKTKNSSYSLINQAEQKKILAWQYRQQRPMVIAATASSNRLNHIGMAILMIFPVTLGYSIIILMLTGNVLASHLLRPMQILQKGIEKITNNQEGLMLEPITSDEFAKLFQGFNEMSLAIKQKAMISRYVSEKLVEKIDGIDNSMAQTEELAEVTILASDIRGFTSITESNSPLEVVDMLNMYFTTMESAIEASCGIIDKFVGDAVLAVFYSERGKPDPALRACNAAVQMRKNLMEFNKIRSSENKFCIENGIGLATGQVISGSIGSEKGRKSFTIVGKVIDYANKLESMTAQSEHKIMICSATAEKVSGSMEIIDVGQDVYALRLKV